MAGIIEIRDKTAPGVLTLTLRDLLAFFEDRGPHLVWSILDLEAVGDPDKLKIELLELERKARESPHGFILKWEDLVALAESLVDVWGTLIAASDTADSIPRLTHGTEQFEPCEVALEAFDSSFWRVYARDDAIIRKLESSFHDVDVNFIAG